MILPDLPGDWSVPTLFSSITENPWVVIKFVFYSLSGLGYSLSGLSWLLLIAVS